MGLRNDTWIFIKRCYADNHMGLMRAFGYHVRAAN